jgi:YVTN family beta-propeller protein
VDLPTVADIQPGDVFAGHRVEGIAGRGGMGVVYRAVQLDLDRPVALKLIAGALAQDGEFRDRFVRESRAAASIDHPNVIPIYYTGEHEGLLYIVMRYVEGSDLRTAVRAEGRLAPGRAARIVAQVGAALDAAHARGLVHRDVKPANVLLGAEDHAYLTDFGLTKRLHSSGGAPTRPGGWVGTLGYVAPEQIRGGRVDARSDVYALGCVLFQALTGAAPYRRDSDEATLWAHLNDPPPELAGHGSGVPAAFDDVLRRALAKDPADRFPSAGDLGRAALAAAGERISVPTRPERVVAVGAAAPADEQETLASPDQAATRHAPTAATAATAGVPTSPVTSGRSRVGGFGFAWAAALLPVLALAVIAFVVLGGGSGDDNATGRQEDPPGATGEASPRATGTVAETVRVGGRPNEVVVAGGDVWVLRSGSDRVSVIDPETGRRLPREKSPRVGKLPAAAAAGFGKLWVARQRDPALVSIDLKTRRRVGREIPLPAGGKVVGVAAGENAIWVGIRGRPGHVLRIDPRTRVPVRDIMLPAGVQDLAVGADAVWVIARRRKLVTRVDIREGTQQEINVGDGPAGIAVGENGVWVTNSEDDTVTRIDPGSRYTQNVQVGRTPYGVAVGGGAVWVANRDANTLTRIDPRTVERAGPSVRVAGNPYAIDVREDQVWVSSLARGTVTRIDF